MITCAKTKDKPVNIALNNEENTLPILAFDREGKINVFSFEDTSLLQEEIALDKSKHIPLGDWVKANILYHISQKLCLMPGESEANDKEIIGHLLESLSDNIINKKEVVTEICDTWNKVTKKINSETNDIKESNKTELEYHGAYELSLHNYFAKFLSITQDKIAPKYYSQGVELIKSTLDGRAFSRNPYLQRLALLSLGDTCAKVFPAFKDAYNLIKEKIKANEQLWFFTLTGTVEMEIDDLLTAPETQSSILEIKEVLSDLLNRNIAQLSADTKIGQFLPLTISLMKSPLTHELYKRLAEKPSEEQILQAIEYVIEKNIRQPSIGLKLSTTNAFQEILRLARSDQEKDKKELLKILVDDTQPLTPPLLNAIIKQSKMPEIQDIAANLLDKIIIEKLKVQDQKEDQAEKEKDKQAKKTLKKAQKLLEETAKKKKKLLNDFEQFENESAAHFSFWSKIITSFAFILTFGAIMVSAPLTVTLACKALFFAIGAAGLCKMGLSSIFEARRRYIRLARNTYDPTKLDTIHDPAEIEALQIGVEAATNDRKYYTSYFRRHAYNYPAFLGGYVPATRGNNEISTKIKNLKAH